MFQELFVKHNIEVPPDLDKKESLEEIFQVLDELCQTGIKLGTRPFAKTTSEITSKNDSSRPITTTPKPNREVNDLNKFLAGTKPVPKPDSGLPLTPRPKSIHPGRPVIGKRTQNFEGGDFEEEADFNFEDSDVTGERGRPLTNAQKQQRLQQQQQQQQQQQLLRDKQQQYHQQQQQQQQRYRNQRPQPNNDAVRRKLSYFGENLAFGQNLNFQPKRKQPQIQNGPGPNDRIMYNQSPKIGFPNGGLLRGRPLPANKVAPVVAANQRYDIVAPTQPPIPLSRPHPYPSFSSYPLPESSDPLTLHQLSTTSQEVTTTAPLRHYTHFNRLDAVSFKQVEQRDQIGLFLNCLRSNFSLKSSPNIWSFFGLFERWQYLSLNCCSYFLNFGQLLRKLGNVLFNRLVTLIKSSDSVA